MTIVNKNIDYYMSLPWSYTVERHTDAGVYYVARVNELNCMTDASTPEKAVKELEKALRSHLEACLAEGVEISEPLQVENFKGQIAYRTKPERHYRLAKEAQRRGVSISKLIDEAVNSILTA